MDHAATTPIDERVQKTMQETAPFFGNPSSIHGFGQDARNIIDKSRKVLADFLGAKPSEIIFTSGGSESDNLAIKGVVNAFYRVNGEWRMANNKKPHVITTEFEHHAVLNTVKELEQQGIVEASYVKPNSDGIIEAESVIHEIRENTVLVSVMYVNNEIGTVQPIREIGKAIEEINKERIRNNELGITNKTLTSEFEIRNSKQNLPKILFHTDAVQAAEYFFMNVDYLKVDLLTMTAHKIYGPKGTGLLYARTGTKLASQITGGEQEFRKRAGTENTIGIAAFAKAVELIALEQQGAVRDEQIKSLVSSPEAIRLIELRDYLIKNILSKITESELNGDAILRSPANANISFLNAEGESILLNLDMLGIAASSGSACTSGALEPSHVLLSIGKPHEKAHGSVRFTLGHETTKEDLDHVLKVLPGIIEKLRAMAPKKGVRE